MKSQAITKTFRVIPESISIIDAFAKKNDVGISEALNTLLKISQRILNEKQLDWELELLSQNKKWLKEDEAWANLDLTS